MRLTLAAATVGLLLTLVGPAAGAPLDRHALPGAAAFPEGLAAARDGTFYTGSLIDGTLFKGSVEDPAASVLSPAGADGRSSVAGMEVDPRGRL